MYTAVALETKVIQTEVFSSHISKMCGLVVYLGIVNCPECVVEWYNLDEVDENLEE